MSIRLSKLLVLCLSAFVALIAPSAAQAPTDPILRIEPGTHAAAVMKLSATADGRLLASGSDDKTVRIWSVPDGRLVRTLRPAVGPNRDGSVYAVAMDPAGKWVAAGGWTQAGGRHFVSVFDISTGAIVAHLGPHPNVITDLAVSPDGRRLAAALFGDNGIRVWDTATWNLAYSDGDYKDTARSLSFARDGRLAVVGDQGLVRLYGTDGRRQATAKAPGGLELRGVDITPDGTRLAIGYGDSARVDVLDGRTLQPLWRADTTGIGNGNLGRVAWLDDGKRLAAGGTYNSGGLRPVLVWADAGRGARSNWRGPKNTLFDLVPMAGGGLAYAAADASVAVFSAAGRQVFLKTAPLADMREKVGAHFLVSGDGRRVSFGLDPADGSPMLLDLAQPSLVPWSQVRGQSTTLVSLSQPDVTSVRVDGWLNLAKPSLANRVLELGDGEISRSLAALPGGTGFVLGSEWSLNRFSRDGRLEWRNQTTAPVWGVNTSRDGKLIIAAHGDGTLRWHRASDGRELLAAFVLVDRSGPAPVAKGFVLWTPKGYYHASPGTEDIIGWHVNNGLDKAADFFLASRFRAQFSRPDVVARVLDVLDEDVAIDGANGEARRRRDDDVKASLPPVIDILSPGDGHRFSAPTVTIEFAVRSPSGLPVTGVDVLIDGRPIETTRGLQRTEPTAAGRQTITLPVPPRDVEISILARTAKSAGEAARRKLVYAAAPAPAQQAPTMAPPSDQLKPKLYAVVVGVSRYAQADKNLQFAHKDAEDMAKALARQKGGLYRDVEIKLLTDASATADNIRAAFGWLEKEVTSRDVALVFMAGHGVTDLQQRFWFMPTGADADNLRGTAIPKNDFEDVLRALPSKVLMFIDACHAGKGIERTRYVTRGGGAGADITMLVNELTSTENGVVMFASSTGRQLSQESSEWQNGAFTKAVVEGLSGKADYNKDGAISIKELDLYVSERVKELTRGGQSPVARKPETIPDFPLAVIR